jgi:hypothetical protein
MRNWVVNRLVGQRFLWVITPIITLGIDQAAVGQPASPQDQKPKTAASETKGKKPAAKTESTIPTLEEMLTRAMKDNPDVRVAEAKLREAEAELNRTRLQVTQKVIAYQRTLEAQKEMVKIAEEQLNHMKIQVNAARDENGRQQMITAQQKTLEEFARAKAKLAEIEGEIPYLLGNQPATVSENLIWRYWVDPNVNNSLYRQHAVWGFDHPFVDLDSRYFLFQQQAAGAPSTPGSVIDRIRKALDTPINFNLDNAPLADVMDFINEMAPGANFRIAKSSNIADMKVDLHFKEKIPLGAALQALQDSLANLEFVVRDYGVLVTMFEKVPPGAVRLHDFWKADKRAQEKDKKAPEKNNPSGAAPKQ